MGEKLSAAGKGLVVRLVQGPDHLGLSLQISLQRNHISVGRVLGIRNQGQDGARKLLVEVQQTAKSVHNSLLFDVHVVCALFASLKPQRHVVKRTFHVCDPWIWVPFGDRHRFGGSARLRRRRSRLVVLLMNKRMARGATLYFAQPDQISSFEVAVPVFEFPERRIRTVVENIAHFVEPIHVELPYERRYVRMLKILRQNF